MSGCPLVLVEWEDSRHPTGQWERLADFTPASICKCVSVGFLVYDGPDKKVLAPNMADIEDEQNIQATGMISIPALCVTSIASLEEVTSSSDPVAA